MAIPAGPSSTGERSTLINMSTQYSLESDGILYDLEKVSKARQEFSQYLTNMSEIAGEQASGKLELQIEVEDLGKVATSLREGIFRLLVLGDMKRGKSTFLNALIGEQLLPSDVNPCTALLTILRYGEAKDVTLYFNDGKDPESLDFETFKQTCTIPPDEAKRLEEESQQAFPDVDYAVVQSPLSILEKGVEIIDSPGLNDTEARNALVLGYIRECHAILFVLSATTPFTLSERRYLENYIQGKGLTVFFLINMWDEIQRRLIDPGHSNELREAEGRLRQVFRANLEKECRIDGKDLYRQRVFEISALDALRARLSNPPRSLDGTGFTGFADALNTFLTRDRALVEFGKARIIAAQAGNQVRDKVWQRIKLLDDSTEELKQKINAVQPEFAGLTVIRDQFIQEINHTRDQVGQELGQSFQSYFPQLEATFETDFTRYQPEIKLLEFLRKSKREALESELKHSFEQYMNDNDKERNAGVPACRSRCRQQCGLPERRQILHRLRQRSNRTHQQRRQLA